MLVGYARVSTIGSNPTKVRKRPRNSDKYILCVAALRMSKNDFLGAERSYFRLQP